MAPAYLLVAVAASVVMSLAVPSVGDKFVQRSFYHLDSSCSVTPLAVYFSRWTISNPTCESRARTCSVEDDEFYPNQYSTAECVIFDDPASSAPTPGSHPVDFVVETVFNIGSDCDNSNGANNYYYHALDVCMIDVDDPTSYMKYELTDTHIVVKYNCDNTCTTCSLTPQTYDRDSCSYDRMWSYYESPKTSFFTEPTTIIGTPSAAVSVSQSRDCYAAVGQTVLGGWAVNDGSDDYCCTVRGDLVEGVSLTGCLLSPSSTSFYQDGASTYQECYGNPAPKPSALIVEEELNSAANYGAAVPDASKPAVLLREYAVNIMGELEGAYRVNINTDANPFYLYCTGRGVVTDNAECRRNSCDDTTPDFVVYDGVAEGEFCYHTCFSRNDA